MTEELRQKLLHSAEGPGAEPFSQYNHMKVTAVGTVEKTGGHMGFSRTDIRDESGRLIAALRTVMYLTGRPLEL